LEIVLQLVALAAVGFFAGTVNTLAGGGSLLTLPALIFFGLPAGVANGTNRVGVIVQSAVAAWRFKRGGALPVGLILRLAPPMVVGAVAGAWLSVDVDEALFRRIIGIAMIVMVGVVLLRPKAWLARFQGKLPARAATVVQVVVFAALGFYAGFLQAGVGVFALSAIVLICGTDLVRGNAVKVGLVGIVTLPALAVFIWQDLVAWGPGLSVAAGQIFGGWFGARLTLTRGAGFVRFVLAAVVLVSASKLLGFW
jgi:uncharacterized protein